MRTPVYILFFLTVVINSTAQIIDTSFVGETVTYRVRNQQSKSWLHWEVTGGYILSENPSQTDSIVVSWNTAGIHEVSVYEVTQYSCHGELAKVEILVIENDFEIELKIPNAFSPNEDNKNDYFTIGYNFPPENYKLTIYSRWGTTVFETHDISYSWDGRVSGEYCTPGVYYYVIQYQNKGRTEIKKGFFHLFR